MTPTSGGALTVDGAPVDTEVDAERPRPVELTFAGSAGQLVYPEIPGADFSGPGVRWTSFVLAPSGRALLPIAGLVRLPSTGVYTVYLVPNPHRSFASPLTVRVRTPLPLAPMAADGTARTFVADPTGRWQYAPVPLNPDQRYFFEPRGDRSTAFWSAAIQSPEPASCINSGRGCGNATSVSLFSNVGGQQFEPRGTRNSEALLVVRLGAAGGEVDLAVTPLGA